MGLPSMEDILRAQIQWHKTGITSNSLLQLGCFLENQQVFFIRFCLQTEHGEKKARLALRFLRRHPDLLLCTFRQIPAGFPGIPSFSELQPPMKLATVSSESAAMSQERQNDQFRTF